MRAETQEKLMPGLNLQYTIYSLQKGNFLSFFRVEIVYPKQDLFTLI